MCMLQILVDPTPAPMPARPLDPLTTLADSTLAGKTKCPNVVSVFVFHASAEGTDI